MAISSSWRRPVVWVAIVGVLLAVGAAVYFLWLRPRPASLPEPGSPLYEEYAAAFEMGTAALDIDFYDRAVEQLTAAIEKVPGEPAAWANRGLLYTRHDKRK